MKCVTNHVYSQKTALRMGASPLAMFLAGVPRWVVYDQDRASTAQPISIRAPAARTGSRSAPTAR